MSLLTDIEWSVEDIIDLQEHLDSLPDNWARKKLLTEGYECTTSFAERYLDTLRHVHPVHLVGLLDRPGVQIKRLPHEEALLVVKAISYADPVGEDAVHNVMKEGAA